jgi:hypothetical protein
MTDEQPIAYQALAKGTRVTCADGTEIGTVEHVLQEPDLDLFDGVAVKTREGLRFIDRDQITTITTQAVTTSLSPAQAGDLPKPEGTDMYHADALQDEGPGLTAVFGRMFRREHWTKES